MYKFIHCCVPTGIRYPQLSEAAQLILKQNSDPDLINQVNEQMKEVTAIALENPHINEVVNLAHCVGFHDGEDTSLGEEILKKSAMAICFHMSNGSRIPWIYNHIEDFNRDWSALQSILTPAEQIQPIEDDDWHNGQ